MTATTITIPCIQMPIDDDVEYSDDVYWTRWELRQKLLEYEDYDNKPDSDWSVVWHEFNDDSDYDNCDYDVTNDEDDMNDDYETVYKRYRL
jgi:hypothetical protein